ncbi:MAG: GtrA family protein [Oscillospiraceae bacterium]|nr:GtrA family protein [Oscillospiraceae bacterium]
MSEKKKEVIRAIKFTLFSISAGIVQVIIFTLLNEVLALPYSICYLTALICSVLWNFTLNRKITFRSANNVPLAMLQVALYYLVFTPLSTWGGDRLEALGVNEYIVLAGSMIINFVTEYLYDRLVVFGKSIDTAGKKEKTEKNR